MSNALRSTVSHTLLLSLFALGCAFVVSLVQQISQPRIVEQQRLARTAQLKSVLGNFHYDNVPAETTFELAGAGYGLVQPRTGYLARTSEGGSALVIPVVAPDGYSGAIEMLVGIDLASMGILGVRVTRHRETPGLGDKIEPEKSDWIYGFAGRSLQNPEPQYWALRSEGGVFDQFTGASKTPRAIVRALRRALTTLEQERQLLQSGMGGLLNEIRYRGVEAAEGK